MITATYLILEQRGKRFLLTDAKRRKDPGQHIFGRRLAGDLPEITESVVQPDQYDLFAKFFVQLPDRLLDVTFGP